MIIERRMSRNPVVASPDMSISEASALMKQEKVHRLPVLDKDKKLVGIITEKDILYATPSPMSSLSIHEMAYLLSKLTVKKLMSKNVGDDHQGHNGRRGRPADGRPGSFQSSRDGR